MSIVLLSILVANIGEITIIMVTEKIKAIGITLGDN